MTVLWMGAALSAIALAVSLKARTEVERTSSALEATRAHFLASGAAERALNYVLYGLEGSPRWPDGRVRFWERGMPLLRFRFQTGEAAVEIIPESSRLNVNRLPVEELVRLNLAMGMAMQPAVQLAQAIVDWREPAPMGLFSPFDAIYLRRIPSFRAPHASVQQIDELMNVAGMTSDLFYGGWVRTAEGRLIPRAGLRDCLTVYAAPDGALDVNNATVPAMVAMGVSPQGALAIEQLRSRAPITAQQLQALAGMIGPAMGRLRLGGDNIYTIRATARPFRPDGRPSDLRRTVAMTVQLYFQASAGATRILAWQENAVPRPDIDGWLE